MKANTNGLQYSQKYYETEKHNTIPLISEYDGLRFIFDYYHLDANEKDFLDSTPLIASKFKKHYANISEKLGYKNVAPESLINYLAYDALGKKQHNKAKALAIQYNAETQLKIDQLQGKTIANPTNVDLKKYAGVYMLETYNIPVVLEVRNGALWAKVAGQADDEFQGLSENIFTVKGKQGYKITFQIDGNQPKGFTSVQPNGTFKAVFKNR